MTGGALFSFGLYRGGLFPNFNKLKHLTSGAVTMQVREYTRHTTGKAIGWLFLPYRSAVFIL